MPLLQRGEAFLTAGPVVGSTVAGSLRQPNVLAHLDEGDRRTVVGQGQLRTFEPRQTLFRQGEPRDEIFLIEAGLVRSFYTSPAGREITLAYWPSGNLVGAPEVFGGVHMWSGEAVRRVETLALHGEDLRRLMERMPALAIGIVEALAFKARWLSAFVQMLGTQSVTGRLARLLEILSEVYGTPSGEGTAIGTPFTHEDIASMVGASRQWITTTLDRLQAQGIIRIRKRQVVILQPDLLRRLGSTGY